jgi:hypothetical protein
MIVGWLLLGAFVVVVIVPYVSYVAGASASGSSTDSQALDDEDTKRAKCDRDQDWWNALGWWEKALYFAWWGKHSLGCSKYFNVRW